MRRNLALLTLFAFTASSASILADDDKKAAPPKSGDKKAAAGKGAGKVDRAKLFEKMDTNGDGKLSKEEYKASLDAVKAKAQEKGKGDKAAGKAGDMADKLFEKMDTNKDGFVSKEEFLKFDPAANLPAKGKAKKGG